MLYLDNIHGRIDIIQDGQWRCLSWGCHIPTVNVNRTLVARATIYRPKPLHNASYIWFIDDLVQFNNSSEIQFVLREARPAKLMVIITGFDESDEKGMGIFVRTVRVAKPYEGDDVKPLIDDGITVPPVIRDDEHQHIFAAQHWFATLFVAIGVLTCLIMLFAVGVHVLQTLVVKKGRGMQGSDMEPLLKKKVFYQHFGRNSRLASIEEN